MVRSALQRPARNPPMRNAFTTLIAYRPLYGWPTPKLSPRAAVGIRR